MYKAKLNIKGNTRLQNLRQEFKELLPYTINIYRTVENLRRALNSERANMEVILHDRDYKVVGIAFQEKNDFFLRHGSMLKTLEWLETSEAYLEAKAEIDPLLAAIDEAEREEQSIQEKHNAARQALEAVEQAALEAARQSPEVLKAQEALAAIERQKK